MNSPNQDEDDVPVKDPVKYGELVILGYNGSLPSGDRGRRKSRFALYRRTKANGVKPSTVHILNTPQGSKAVHSRGQHSISFTLSRNQTVVVEYCHDNDTDMFQIGRSTECPIDFVVTDTSGEGKEGEDPSVAPSTISRFACRVVCERSPPYTARIYAAGFDSSKNIFLGEKATKWKNPDGHMDGLTTNGVLVMHPEGFPEDSRQGLWREISVCGDVYALRETRSGPSRGKLAEGESSALRDGSLVDLCGATLLWRTGEGLLHAPTLRHLEALRQELNAARPQCPVGLSTLAFPSLPRSHSFPFLPSLEERQPWVYLTCGHVHGRHDWGQRPERQEARGGGGEGEGEGRISTVRRECPLCRSVGPYVPLWLGCEPAVYVDAGAPTYAFVPCGHVCSERTAKYWADTPLPHGTHAFRPTCPFCSAPLSSTPQGWTRLIFQGPID
ncbi:E3 ubiquitin-protein ligase pellino homolog 2-like isoform X1 [Coregonus clupeaformis]|uniref:E3 ubiquitin-protein ligase pellino homolog 2-like isoform X1 n=1 Tax=Coregonus clupeaformis TaxID=59861 RepID=UPI001BDFFD92|nr:E3 ubiquitin-protein ligase pellino homolog 2-like isoform X1 [Coregonus clupeaformis]